MVPYSTLYATHGICVCMKRMVRTYDVYEWYTWISRTVCKSLRASCPSTMQASNVRINSTPQVTVVAVDKALLELIPNPLPDFGSLFDVFQKSNFVEVGTGYVYAGYRPYKRLHDTAVLRGATGYYS